MLYAVDRFRQQSPKTYRAFLTALDDAARWVRDDPQAAADLFLKANGGKGDRKLVLDVIKNPRVEFKTAPQNTQPIADFMHRVGAIKTAPQKLDDYFFDDPRTAGGS